MCQILQQTPDLVPVIFPHRASDGVFFGDWIFGDQEWQWSWDELRRAFKLLFHQCTQTHRILLFVDGMDEFNGEPTGVIDFVKRLAMPGIKICASSRPWNQFQDAFNHGPHLRIGQLTQGDMKRFASSNLSCSAAFSDYEASNPGFADRLVQDICKRSNGVFLWVHLVTKSLTQGLSNGEKPNDLQTRLRTLPTDLEDLFEKILSAMGAWHSERSSQLLQLHRNALRPLTLLDMFFADEEEPDFAIKASCKAMTLQELNSKAELMKRRINAFTKGLLEADTRNVDQPFRAKIGLLHRTVKDYLHRPEIWKRICAAAPSSFICNSRLYNCGIMRLKTHPSRDDCDDYFEDVNYTSIYAERSSEISGFKKLDLIASLDQLYSDILKGVLPDAPSHHDSKFKQFASSNCNYQIGSTE